MDSIYLVKTTFPTREEAVDMANLIIEKQLGAGVQIQEACLSIYKWKDRIESTKEFPVHIKTIESKKETLKNFIQENHSYEVPEILAIKLNDVSQAYAEWVCAQMNGVDS
jgi:periplasmic divalent cation tolerance protein